MSCGCHRVVRQMGERLGLVDRQERDISQVELERRLQNTQKVVDRCWKNRERLEQRWGLYAEEQISMYQGYLPDHFEKALQNFAAEGIEPGLAVELGCGNSMIVPQLLQRGWRVVAVDSCQHALDLLRANIETYLPEKMGQLTLVRKDMESYQFPKNVRAIFALNALPHCLPNKVLKLWERAHKALEPGGRIAANFFPHLVFSSGENFYTSVSGLWFSEESEVRALLQRHQYTIECLDTPPRYHDYVFGIQRGINFVGKK